MHRLRIYSFLLLGWPLLCAAANETPSPAHVDQTQHPYHHKGIYHRLDSDLHFGLSLEGLYAPKTGDLGWEANVRAGYLDTLAINMGAAGLHHHDFVLLGWELRPLFLFRALLDHEIGNPTIDLSIDSLALEAGVFWDTKVSIKRPGWYLGTSVEVPLMVSGKRFSVLAVRVGVRLEQGLDPVLDDIHTHSVVAAGLVYSFGLDSGLASTEHFVEAGPGEP